MSRPTAPDITVRRLRPADVKLWKDIRYSALVYAPEAFGRTLTSFHQQTDDEHRARLRNSVTYGAFHEGRIVGSLSWQRFEGETEAHRAGVYSVFVRPHLQGSGAAEAMLSLAIAEARPEVLQFELDVGVENSRAIAFYARNGFQLIGITPRALRHGDTFVDEARMVLKLDA